VPPRDWPQDALVLLIGPAGVGKSTWARQQVPAGVVISSDRLRALVSGQADDQSATADAFRSLHMIVRARLKRGLLTVVDATNVTAGARRSLAAMAADSGRPTIAVVFELSLADNLARNAARTERRVPDDVVRKHHQQMATTLARLPHEGYVAIETATEGEMAGP
jgi:protein phosphatase